MAKTSKQAQAPVEVVRTQADIDADFKAAQDEIFVRAWNRDHPEDQRGPVEWHVDYVPSEPEEDEESEADTNEGADQTPPPANDPPGDDNGGK